MATPASVRLQALNGVWETVGVDEFEGIVPEGIQPSADQLGPSTLSFQLRRSLDLIYPDLSAWTPCEIEKGGLVIWDGRVKETPGQSDSASGDLITVNGVGYAGHLDDDSYERSYIHQDLTAWQDSRSNLAQDLTHWVAAPTVTASNGQVGLAFPQGSAIPSGCGAGVTLDLGQSNLAAAAVASVVLAGAIAGVGIYLRTSSVPDGVYGPAGFLVSDAVSNLQPGNVPINIGGIFTTPCRYVHLFIYNGNVGAVTPTADMVLTISRIIVAANDPGYLSYQSNGTVSGFSLSDLRASDVVLDAIQTACPLVTAAPRSPAYRDEVLADRPQSYWRLGNNIVPPPPDRIYPAGAPWDADLGAANNPITSSSGVAAGAAGLLQDDGDQAFAFAGAGYAQASTFNVYNSNDFTLEVIFSPSTIPAGVFTSIGPRIEGRHGLWINASGRLEFFFYTLGNSNGISQYAANSLTLVANQTYHVVCTWNGIGAVGMTVNGVGQALTLTGGTGASGVASVTFSTATGVFLGAANASAVQPFTGIIDEAAIFPYALSSRQVQNHYQAARARLYGGIQRTQFKIPHYSPAGGQTPHTKIDSVNSLHNWRVKIPVGRAAIFQPQPSLPLLKVSPHVAFSDAGANDGEVIYNKCVVEGQDATGQPVRSVVTASQLLPTAPATTSGVPQFPNGTFEAGTGGWTFPGATLTQDATHVHSGSFSGKLAASAHPSTVIAGAFQAGATYTLQIWTFTNSAAGYTIAIAGAPIPSQTITTVRTPTVGVWQQVSITFSPNQTLSTITVTVTNNGGAVCWMDDLSISRIVPTIVDRRGFNRTKTLQASAAIDQPTADQLASAFLLNAMSSPFRGSFTASSPDDVLLLPGETPVNPEELLLHTGELVRVPVIDPDTGDFGRDGKIITVTFSDDSGQANVTVDDDRNNLQALMQRMAVTSGAAGI